MNSKKILFLIDTCGPGGAESVFLSLVDNIVQQGFTPIIILPDAGWLYQQLNESSFDVRIVNSKGKFNLKYLANLVKVIRNENISLIHSHLFGSTLYGALAAKIADVPIIGTFHGFVDLGGQVRLLKLKRWIILKLATYVVFVSESLATEALPARYHSSAKKVVIHNGVAFEAAPPIPRNRQINSPVTIGCLGNIRPPKDYETLLDVASALKKQNIKAVLNIYGDKENDYFKTLQTKLDQLDLQNVVIFKGHTSNIYAALDSMDIFLLTSKSEGFSLATVEAMSRKLPVIASRSGGPEEIITDHHDGLLIDVGDVDGFSSALVNLINDPEKRKRLAENAYTTSRENFSLEKMINKYIDLYLIATK